MNTTTKLTTEELTIIVEGTVFGNKNGRFYHYSNQARAAQVAKHLRSIGYVVEQTKRTVRVTGVVA